MEKTGLWGKEEKRENRWLLFLCLLDTVPLVNTLLKELNCVKNLSVTRKIFVMSYELIQM